MKLTNLFARSNKKKSIPEEATKKLQKPTPPKKMADKKDICPELSLEPELSPNHEVMIVSCG